MMSVLAFVRHIEMSERDISAAQENRCEDIQQNEAVQEQEGFNRDNASAPQMEKRRPRLCDTEKCTFNPGVVFRYNSAESKDCGSFIVAERNSLSSTWLPRRSISPSYEDRKS